VISASTFFLKIVQHKNLAVKSEFPLYKTICQYIKNNPDLNKYQIFKLFQNVRFRWLSYEELCEVSQNQLVPRSLIIEVTMARLKDHETPEEQKQNASVPLRLQPRPRFSITFSLNKDNNNFFKGIIGWIATNYGQGEWQNPHRHGRVKVHSSTLSKGSRATLVDVQCAEIWTLDMPNMWFSIDFGPTRSVNPTSYSLRHGGNWKADAVRTWDLQGSLDGVIWMTLKRHTNDCSLNAAFACHSWHLPESKESSYRFFRIYHTGRNSSNRNFLVISGFEFFGKLYEWK